MKALNTIVRITAALLIAASAGACKSETEKREENVQEAREKVIEKSQEVREQEGDVAEAKQELAQARMEFLNNVDARLKELDGRIAASKANATIDQGRIATLRAEANALRTQIADESRPYAEDARTTFDRIVRDIEAELDRGDETK